MADFPPPEADLHKKTCIFGSRVGIRGQQGSGEAKARVSLVSSAKIQSLFKSYCHSHDAVGSELLQVPISTEQ